MYRFIFNVKERAIYPTSIVHFLALIYAFVSVSGIEGNKGLFLGVRRPRVRHVIFYRFL